jgi:competence protein ComEA
MRREFARLLACLILVLGLVGLSVAALSRLGSPSSRPPRPRRDRARAAPGEPPEAAVLFSDRLDLNAASIEELAAIPGIGRSRAARIVEARDGRGGRFEHLDDLLDVPGIGPRTHAKLVPYLRVDRAGPRDPRPPRAPP